MFSYRINVNIVPTTKQHRLNFIVAYIVPIYSQPMKLGKQHFVGTNLLFKNNKLITIQLDTLEGVKFKYIIRKYMRDNWKIKLKDISIKHINNMDSDHNYLILIKRLNKKMQKIKNIISCCDQIAWRTFYEIYTPNDKTALENKNIYNALGNLDSKLISDISVNDKRLPLAVIYKSLSKIM